MSLRALTRGSSDSTFSNSLLSKKFLLMQWNTAGSRLVESVKLPFLNAIKIYVLKKYGFGATFKIGMFKPKRDSVVVEYGLAFQYLT
jgi:hypothetical protein